MNGLEEFFVKCSANGTRGSNVRLREGMDQARSGSSDGVRREKKVET